MGTGGAGGGADRRLFYGWRIVGLTVLAQLIAVGCTSYIFGIYVAPVATELDASRLVVTSGLAVLLLSMTFVTPVLGHWLDRHSIRNAMSLGALLMGLGFGALSLATAIWQMGLILVFLVGLGAAMLGHLPSSKLVTNWFSAQRGRALGISTLGTSLGGFLLPPLAAWLILTIGWRGSLFCLSLSILFVVLPLVYLTVVNTPRDLGLEVDGGAGLAVPDTGLETAVAQAPSAGVREILSNRSFWGIGLCVGCMASLGAVFLTHFAPYATEYDFSLAQAALVMSCYAVTAMVGKLGFGYLADSYDKRLLLRIAIVWNSLFWVIYLGPHSLTAMMLGGAVLGLGSGAVMPLWNALVGACFGRLVFARTMGYMSLLTLPLIVFPMPLGGWIYDQTGSYLLIFQGAMLLFPLAFLATFLIRVPDREPDS